MSNPIIDKANTWLNPVFDEETQATVRALIDNDLDELTESFYTDLDFGTGGMRGIMGVGTNRINRYTLGMATQGLSNYLKAQFQDQKISVAIAHDSRNNSKSFARQVSEVFAANGIKVYLFEDLRPTPELSFAIRHLGCQSGIVLTASHNPKEYNGYKVYWDDGGQLVPPHDKNVITEVRKVTAADIQFDYNDDLIEYIGKEVDDAYLKEVAKLSLSNAGKDDLDVVFTALHGTSIVSVPPALKAAGFTKIQLVDAQSTPDGNFPTVPSPNPEEGAALEMAVAQANATNADLVIGCDPDTDRVGIAVRNLENEMVLLNGNQTAAVLFYYILNQYKSENKLQGNEFVAETIVTSDLIEKIADHFGIECFKCLTGFKWIAEIIKREEGKKKFIVGGEESYGYLIGDFVRDKDAVSASVLIAEAAAWAKANGGSFYSTLLDIYTEIGYYQEALISIKKEGKSGKEEIAAMMEGLRTNPPASIVGSAVVEVLDYAESVSTNLLTGEKSTIALPASNVIQLITEAGDKVTARPSGTEPKIKFYFSVNTNLSDKAEFKQKEAELLERIARIQKEMNLV
jgi:phosphoglucomutase